MLTAEEQAREQNDALAHRDEYMDTIVVELSALATDDTRDVVKAAQIILQGKKDEIRNLCKPWGVQLTVQKRKRTLESIKDDLKRTLIKRAVELKRSFKMWNAPKRHEQWRAVRRRYLFV